MNSTPLLRQTIESIQQMFSQKLSQLFVFNKYSGLYKKDFLLMLFSEAFKNIKLKGNTKLKLPQQFFRVFFQQSDITDEKSGSVYIYRCKFKGNKTKHHISLFIEVKNNYIVDCYDVQDVKKKTGASAIDEFQVLVFPLKEHIYA